MKLKITLLLLVITLLVVRVYSQVALPSGGAIEAMRKEDFAVDILCWLVLLMTAVIVYQESQKRKKDKEIADLKDNQIKNLEQKLMRYESKG